MAEKKPSNALKKRESGRPTGVKKSAGILRYEEVVAKELRILIAEKALKLRIVREKLCERGIRESERGLSAKLAAGSFSAAYYLAIKDVIKSL